MKNEVKAYLDSLWAKYTNEAGVEEHAHGEVIEISDEGCTIWVKD